MGKNVKAFKSKKKKQGSGLANVAKLYDLIPKDLKPSADGVRRLKNSRSMKRLASVTRQSEEEIRKSVFERDENGKRIALIKWSDESVDLNDIKKLCEYTRYLFELGGNTKKADKLKDCCDFVSFAEADDGVNPVRRQLHMASYCRDRMCPICMPIRAHKNVLTYYNAIRLSHELHPEIPNLKEIFLTLTVRNPILDNLEAALIQVTKGINHLSKHKPFKRAILGWLWVLEMTWNPKAKTVNLHAHLIMQVDNDKYYEDSDIWIDQDQWCQMWRTAASLDYDPVCWVEWAKKRIVKNRVGKEVEINETLSAVKEVVKYSFKPASIFKKSIAVEEQSMVLCGISDAIYRKHLVGAGGFIKDAVKILKEHPELATYEDEETDPNYGLEPIKERLKPEEITHISYYRFDYHDAQYYRVMRVPVAKDEPVDLSSNDYAEMAFKLASDIQLE